MSHNEPKCPYCGGEMRIERGHERGLSYACPTCWSESPFVMYKPGEDTEALCYEAAMRLPLHKPLTKEQIFQLIAKGEYFIAYYEEIGASGSCAGLWNGGKGIDEAGCTFEADKLLWNDYGRTWRVWATKPTDEERAAAPWEE